MHKSWQRLFQWVFKLTLTAKIVLRGALLATLLIKPLKDIQERVLIIVLVRVLVNLTLML